MQGIYAAVTRRRADGHPGPAGWYPEESVSVAEAVYAYTAGAAYAAGEEQIKGTVAPGMLADLTVLSTDIFREASDAILETETVATLVGGEFVFGGERL